MAVGGSGQQLMIQEQRGRFNYETRSFGLRCPSTEHGIQGTIVASGAVFSEPSARFVGAFTIDR